MAALEMIANVEAHIFGSKLKLRGDKVKSYGFDNWYLL
jgi:hypothetical protein